MKILSTIVGLLSISSAAASGWGRPRKGRSLATLPREITKESSSPVSSSSISNEALLTEQKEELLAPRGGANTKASDDTKVLVRIGDFGNLLVFIATSWLLYETITHISKKEMLAPCGFANNQCQPPLSHPYFDPCYTCDGFCTSSPNKFVFSNSHILSFVADSILTVPLLVMYHTRQSDFKRLKLNDYLLTKTRIIGVFFHGVAHAALGYMSSRPSAEMASKVFFATPTKYASLIGLLASMFMTPGALATIKKFVGLDTSDEATLKKDVAFSKNWVAPALAPIGLAQSMTNSDGPPLTNLLIFGLVNYLFLDSGAPENVHGIITAAVAAFLVWASRDLPQRYENDFGSAFVVVFSAAYMYAAFCQLIFWKPEEKAKRAKGYVVTTYANSLFTAFVGWALALKCTSLLGFGAHSLYDISIAATYFLVFYLTKYWADRV